MKNFTFIPAPDLKTALNILDKEKEKAMPVAGATNVMVDIREGKINDKVLVGIQDIKELHGIKLTRGKVYIGALTTITELADSLLLEKKAPALFQAAQVFADPLTRNSATIGGNIAYASPSADTAPPLLALNANVVIARKGGKRTMPINEYFQTKTAGGNVGIEPGELIVGFEFAACPNSAFFKMGRRKAMSISMASIAVALKKDREGNITDICIGAGSLGPKPLRCYNTEKLLIGKNPAKEDVGKLVSEVIFTDINPRDSWRSNKAYREAIAPVMLKRMVNKACGICAINEGRNC